MNSRPGLGFRFRVHAAHNAARARAAQRAAAAEDVYAPAQRTDRGSGSAREKPKWSKREEAFQRGVFARTRVEELAHHRHVLVEPARQALRGTGSVRGRALRPSGRWRRLAGPPRDSPGTRSRTLGRGRGAPATGSAAPSARSQQEIRRTHNSTKRMQKAPTHSTTRARQGSSFVTHLEKLEHAVPLLVRDVDARGVVRRHLRPGPGASRNNARPWSPREASFP